MNVTKEEIKQFLKDYIELLVSQDQGCATLKLDDRLAICVGWLNGYDENDEDLIHSKEEPSWVLNAGIKVYTSDDMRTDYEFINAPYHDNGEVVSTDVSLKPNEDLDALADYFIKEYANLENLEIDEDGKIIEDKDFDDSYEDVEDDETNKGNPYDLEKLPDEGMNSEEIKAKEDEVKDESCEKKEVKESWEGESIIDDLVDRANGMLKDGGYGDIDDCIRQAIDDGLIYSDDIRELADHYGTLPEDSELIEGFYDELYNDIASRVEEPEEDEEEEDDFEDAKKKDESLNETKGNRNYYLDLEKMTIEDIRTAPIGWYWEGDGETVIKIDEDKVFLVANYIGDTVENYVKGMIEEFGPNAKLKDICDDDYYENNLGIMSEDELEEYRDDWEDAYIGN